MSTAIVWFRRDLRLGDNPALDAALRSADRVVPVFVLDPDDPETQGGASRWWLAHSLASLSEALAQRGSCMVLRRGDPLTELRAVVAATGADSVHWNRRYSPAAVAGDARVKTALRADGLVTHSHKGSLLAEPWEVRTKADAPFRVYTPFWRALRQQLEIDAPLTAPDRVPTTPGLDAGLDLSALALLPAIDWASGIAAAWAPGEAGARERLGTFLDERIDGYSEGRDQPGIDGVSRLSPHLARGEISPRSVWHATVVASEGRALEGAGSAHRFLQEIVWREFGYHILFNFPHTVSEPMQPHFAAFPWRAASDYADDLARWRRGMTGIPIVDAGMRQLWATGWMHNRVRMIVASLLVKNLLIPWWEGADHFMDTLVDADLASNTMGWQWVAGSGADAAPYFRIFNPVTQGERFDADGSYVRRWVPEVAGLPDAVIHHPWDAGGAQGYPAPIVDLKGSRQRALDALRATRG